MRLRIFDTRRVRSEHARELGLDDDHSPRARFPGGRACRGDPISSVGPPFDDAHLGEPRDVAARRGRRARAAPRCAARENAPPRAPGPTVPGDPRPSRARVPKPPVSLSPRPPPEPPTCRFCFEGPAFGALVSPCACSGTQAHVHIKCLRRWQRTTRASDGGRTCHVCRRVFLTPPPSLAERVSLNAWRAARARALPFFVLSARLAADLAREDSAASALRGRGVLACAAAAAAFLMDCERLYRFSAAEAWENARAHLATVALQGALTKAVERDARAFREAVARGSAGGGDAYVAEPMAGWVHFAHDLLNFPHLMTLCYGLLCVDADRASVTARAVRGMRVASSPAGGGGERPSWLERAVAAALKAFSLGGAPAGAETAGVVAEARRALLASARWLERAAEGEVSVGTWRATGSV